MNAAKKNAEISLADAIRQVADCLGYAIPKEKVTYIRTEVIQEVVKLSKEPVV